MFEELRTYWASYTGPTAKKGLIALVDQGVISGANFIVGVLVGRLCSQEEFGTYVLVYSVMLLLNSIQSSLITGPMLVLAAGKTDPERKSYVSAVAAAQLAVGGFFGLAVSVSAFVVARFSGPPSLHQSLLAMGGAIFLLQIYEYLRRLLFVSLRIKDALVVDIFFVVVWLSGLLLLWRVGGGTWTQATPGALTSRNVFLCQALAAFLTSLLLLRYCGRHVTAWDRTYKEHLKANWEFGKWGLGSTMANYIALNGYVILLAILASEREVSFLGAPRYVVAPVQVFLLAAASFLPPFLSATYARGGATALWEKLMVALPSLLPVFLYCLLVIAFAGQFLHVFYGDKYLGAQLIAQVTAGAYLFHSIYLYLVVAMGAMRQPQVGFYASLCASLSTVLVGPVLISACGSLGAAIGQLVAVSLMCGVTYWNYRRLGAQSVSEGGRVRDCYHR